MSEREHSGDPSTPSSNRRAVEHHRLARVASDVVARARGGRQQWVTRALTAIVEPGCRRTPRPSSRRQHRRARRARESRSKQVNEAVSVLLRSGCWRSRPGSSRRALARHPPRARERPTKRAHADVSRKGGRSTPSCIFIDTSNVLARNRGASTSSCKISRVCANPIA